MGRYQPEICGADILKRFGVCALHLLVLSSCVAAVNSIGYAQTTSTPEPLAQTEERFHCKTDDEWSKGAGSGVGVREHGLTKCGQEWALQNANELVTIRAVQLREIRIELDRVKQGTDGERDSYQTKLANDHLCKRPSEEGFDDCYNRVKRQVLSQSVQLRESTIQNNTSRYSLGDGEEAKVSAGGPAPNSPQAKNARSGLQVIQEYRQQKTDPQRKNPCAANPFVPCMVTFGKNSLDNNVQVPDEASSKFMQGAPVSGVASKQFEDAGSAGKLTEVQNGVDQALSKQIELNLLNRNSVFSKGAYSRDIDHAKAVQRTLNERDQKGKTEEVNPNSGSSASWTAFQKTMEIIEAQEKKEQKTRDPNVQHTYTLQIQRSTTRTPAQNGKNPITSAPGITGDGLVQDTLGMAPPSPAAAPATPGQP